MTLMTVMVMLLLLIPPALHPLLQRQEFQMEHIAAAGEDSLTALGPSSPMGVL